MNFSKLSKTVFLIFFALLTFAVFAHFLGGFDPFNLKKLVIRDQYIGEKIYLDKVVMPKSGSVLIERVDLENINSGSEVGQSFVVQLAPGTHTNVEISLYDNASSVSEGLFKATLFEDTNGNGLAEPREGDGYMLHNNEPITETFRLK